MRFGGGRNEWSKPRAVWPLTAELVRMPSFRTPVAISLSICIDTFIYTYIHIFIYVYVCATQCLTALPPATGKNLLR